MEKKWHLLLGVSMGVFGLYGLNNTAFADQVEVNTVTELQEAVKTAPEDRQIRLSESFPKDLTTTIALTESPYTIEIDGNGQTLQSSSGKNLFSYGGGTGSADSNLMLKNMTLEGLGNNARALSVGGYKGDFVLDNMKINNFQSFDDGGAFYTSGITYIKNSTFSNNKNIGSGYSGGAIASKGFAATFEVSNTKFIGNETTQAGTGNVGGEGGALYFFQPSNTASFAFKNNYFEGNKSVETINSGSAKLADGDAVTFFNIVEGTDILFEGNTFTNNVAGDDGGGILIQTNSNLSSGVQLNNNTFYKNKALGQDVSANSGGAIQIYANGGILEGRKAVIDYTNNTFVENEAVYDGGAIGSSGYVTNTSAGRYANNLFVGNKSRTASKNNVADATIANAGNLETKVGYDNGTPTTVTMSDVFGTAEVGLVENYNRISAGTSADRMIIPTLPIAPEKNADTQVTNLREVTKDQRSFDRTVKGDIGSVEIDWINYDSNGGTFDLDEPLATYDGTVYYEGTTPTNYYQVGHRDLERKIPTAAELKPTRAGYQFVGWSKEKTASQADQNYDPANKITTTKEPTVLYAVWKKSEPVIVHYMTYDENKQLVKISQDETLTGALGAPYHAHIKQIDGYLFSGVKDGDSISGIFNDVPGEITLIYTKETKEKGAVIAQYQDETGHPLAGDEVSFGEIGSSYTTTAKTIAGYTLKEVQGAPTGEYTAGVTKVLYIYQKNPLHQGQVTVQYQLEDGTPLTEATVLAGDIGSYYSAEFKTFTGYALKEVQGKISGTFTDTPQSVTFVYTKAAQEKGIVLAQYQDETGRPLANDEVSMGAIGTAYTTNEKAIAGYSLKEVHGNPAGEYVLGITKVVYVYTKNPLPQGKVTVRYQLTDGTKLEPDVELTGPVGDNYFVDLKTFAGYTLQKIEGTIGGKFTDAEQVVTLIYSSNQQEIQQGFLVVNYQDEAGNQLQSSELFSGAVTSAYQTLPKEIPGYTFKEVQGTPNGNYSVGVTYVTYVYVKNISDPIKQGKVTVHYQTQEQQPLADDAVLTGNVNENYTADIKLFDGYTLKTIIGNSQGIFTVTPQEVTFVYAKENEPVLNGFLVVDYLDEAGKPIAASELFSGHQGTSYHTQPKEIVGYTLKQVVGNETGNYGNDIAKVTYIYTKEKQPQGKVIFHYQDEKGNKLLDDITDEQPLNTPIALSQFIKEITNYTFKEVKGANAGVYIEAVQEITIVYSKKTGQVVANYIDTSGKKIADETFLQGPVESEYQTTAKTIDGYTLKEVIGKQKGTFGEQAAIVTYVYEKQAPSDNGDQPLTSDSTNQVGGGKTSGGTNPSDFTTGKNSPLFGNSSPTVGNSFTRTALPKAGTTQGKQLTMAGVMILIAALLAAAWWKIDSDKESGKGK